MSTSLVTATTGNKFFIQLADEFHFIGDITAVKQLSKELQQLAKTGKADVELSPQDERIAQQWLSVKQLSEQYNLPGITIRQVVKRKQLIGKREGRELLIPISDFLRWLATYQPRNPTIPEGWVTVAQAAKLLKVSRTAASTYALQGRFGAKPISKGRLIMSKVEIIASMEKKVCNE
jgi:hypothetical protein